MQLGTVKNLRIQKGIARGGERSTAARNTLRKVGGGKRTSPADRGVPNPIWLTVPKNLAVRRGASARPHSIRAKRLRTDKEQP
jgi:hypothetical protein